MGWVGLGPGTRVLGISDIQERYREEKRQLGLELVVELDGREGRRTTTALLDDLRPLSGRDLGGHFGCCCCFVVKTKGVVVVVEECWRVD